MENWYHKLNSAYSVLRRSNDSLLYKPLKLSKNGTLWVGFSNSFPFLLIKRWQKGSLLGFIWTLPLKNRSGSNKSPKTSKVAKIANIKDFLNAVILGCVIAMNLAIPVFHSEFDALQLSFPWFGEIPPFGDFGDFWWLLLVATFFDPAGFFSFYPKHILYTPRYKT